MERLLRPKSIAIHCRLHIRSVNSGKKHMEKGAEIFFSTFLCLSNVYLMLIVCSLATEKEIKGEKQNDT